MAERVECTVEEIEILSDEGRTIEGVRVTCSRCGHFVEIYGRSERSIKRGLATLRDECPKDEKNFYIEIDEER